MNNTANEAMAGLHTIEEESSEEDNRTDAEKDKEWNIIRDNQNKVMRNEMMVQLELMAENPKFVDIGNKLKHKLTGWEKMFWVSVLIFVLSFVLVLELRSRLLVQLYTCVQVSVLRNGYPSGDICWLYRHLVEEPDHISAYSLMFLKWFSYYLL